MTPKILVVEDNPLTRKMLRLTLESEGYTVQEAPDARSALAAARRELPALVLQDLILPDMNGMELVRQLRGLLGAELPIIALSGFLNRVEEARSAEVGFTRLLSKPVEPDRLLDVVRPFLPTPRPAAESGQGLRVLLVEADAAHLELTRTYLARHRFSVDCASSPEDALERARQSPPDVVLCDVLGEGLDAYELCLALRTSELLGRVPVVLTSAWSPTAVDRELAARVNATGPVQKTRELKGLVKALLDAAACPPPAAAEALDADARLRQARAAAIALQRQLALGQALARRCTLQAAQISLLSGVADALVLQRDADAALRDVLAATLDAAAISKGALYLDTDAGRLELRHALGFTAAELNGLQGTPGYSELIAEAVVRQATIAIPSASCPPLLAETLLGGIESVSAQIVPLISDGRGVGAMVLCSMHSDVTHEDSIGFARAMGNQLAQSVDLARAFARLTASERRYRAVTEAAHEAISILTADGAILEANPGFERALGRPKAQILGRRIEEFAVPERREGRDASLDGGASLGEAAPPLALLRADGSTVLMEFTRRALDLGGEKLFVSIGRDVTERVRTQAQLMMSDRMASVGVLAAGVAHEINNPLMATVANLDFSLEQLDGLAGALEPSALSGLRELVLDAREGAKRVETIVRDLKIFSKAEEDKRGPVDVERVIESVLRMAWNEIRHRARLVRRYSPVPLVQGNESRLGQVFLNLVMNATQALADGFANDNSITVRTGVDDEGRVVVEVEDTGPGIPPEVFQHLFTPFFTTKPRGVGTGLGLSICRRIVSAYGGEISAHTEVGRGTRFRVMLLPARAAGCEPPLLSVVSPSPDTARRRGRLLVVDDDAMSARAIQRALAHEHDIIIANDAEGALARLMRGEQYDVILCDVMMPVKTGVEFFADLRRSNPSQAARVIFLTGGAFSVKAREFLDQVDNRCLDKPVDVQELRRIVNALL